MHRRENQVARQRSLNRNLSGFKVANLTNQDDVRILSKEGPQQLGERQFLVRIDLALDETINVVFNGILSRQNFGLGVIEFIEAGVQRGGLARTSRPGDDHNAIGAFDQVTNRLKVIRAKTDVVQTQLDIASVQNPHHD